MKSSVLLVCIMTCGRLEKLSDNSCPNKLQSQHSAENLARTQGKLAGKSLLYVNKSNVKVKNYW